MTSNGHRATTISFGVGSILLLLHYPALLPVNEYEMYGWLALYGLTLLIGATSPDYLEFARYEPTHSGRDKRVTLIPHRTITHWPVIWVVPLYFALTLPMQWYYQAAAIGFLSSGLFHVLMDGFSKSGIPFLLPMSKFRVKIPLYTTGKISELFMVIAVTGVIAGATFLILNGFVMFSFRIF